MFFFQLRVVPFLPGKHSTGDDPSQLGAEESKRPRRSGSSPQWSELREGRADESDESYSDDESPPSEQSPPFLILSPTCGGDDEPQAALAPLCAIAQPGQQHATSSDSKYRWLYFHKLVVKGLSVSSP